MGSKLIVSCCALLPSFFVFKGCSYYQVFGPSDAVGFVQKLLKVKNHTHWSNRFFIHCTRFSYMDKACVFSFLVSAIFDEFKPFVATLLHVNGSIIHLGPPLAKKRV